MRKRHLITTALVLGIGITAAVGAYQAESATFILNDGRRISGVLAIRLNEGNVNIRRDKNSFELSREGNKAEYISVPDVAVIDFVEGTPEKRELEALSPGSHSLAMRDGSNRKGKFVDILNATTVRWQRENSSLTDDIPIRDVRRIYLNTESAWRTFNHQQSGAGSGGSNAPQTPSGPGVEVQGNQAWTDTGLTVRRGERIRFVVSGEIVYGNGQTTGPGGNAAMKHTGYPVPGVGVGALIGRIGNGPAFPISPNGQPVGMTGAGRLQLGINDDQFGDNSGAYRVQIVRGNEPANSRTGGNR